jgi:hypothetical protein
MPAPRRPIVPLRQSVRALRSRPAAIRQNDKTNPTQQKKAMFLDERSSILGETKWVETTAVVIMVTPPLMLWR